MGVQKERILIDNLLVRILIDTEMIWWTGLAPWEFEFPFPGSLIGGAGINHSSQTSAQQSLSSPPATPVTSQSLPATPVGNDP